ncbi:protein kinase [Achlya hypogyna]|uniref:Protein kinase n=1 Tax=Achlya hypogyna TaxID=1202772 RepID=A0A1V9YJT0_ACHHY|nr:protein kinase [Achlya hypogyna]
MRSALVGLAAATILAADCPYRGLPNASLVLVADGSCEGSAMCVVSPLCVQASGAAVDDRTRMTSGISAVGNMTLYPYDSLYITNSTVALNTQYMVLPDTLTTLYFTNTGLTALPSRLPADLLMLGLPNNKLTQLDSIPTGLLGLDLADNDIDTIQNQDWTSIKSLDLSGNRLVSFNYVNLSHPMLFFGVAGCSLNSFIATQATFDALDVLTPMANDTAKGFYATTNARVDRGSSWACSTVGGTSRVLWAGKTNATIPVCILDAFEPESGTDQLALGLGIGGGVVFILAVVGAFFLRRWRRTKTDDLDSPVEETKPTQVFYITNKTIVRRRSSSSSSVSAQSIAEHGVDLDLRQLRPHKISSDDYAVVSDGPIAVGNEYEVWLAVYKQERVAVKRPRDRSPESMYRFVSEITLMTRVRESYYVLQLVGVGWRRPVDLECLVEFMDGGDLRTALQRPLLWPEKTRVLLHVGRGLLSLHSQHIIHRDLKAQNVLLDAAKGAKLTNFGSSRQVDESTLTNGTGTYQWMAPEVILSTEYSVSADVYSFGVLLSELSTHKLPYANVLNPVSRLPETQQFIMTQVTLGALRPTLDATTTPDWVLALAARCLAYEPHHRPTTLELVTLLEAYL